MSFLPTTPPSVDPEVDTIPNLDWWPALSLSAFRGGYRIDKTVGDAEAREAVLTAARTINAELAAWKADKTLAGAASLADVESPIYGESSALQQHYLSAVYHQAKAIAVQNYLHYDTTKSGHDEEDWSEAMVRQADIYLARSRSAIRAILGKTRSTVELI